MGAMTEEEAEALVDAKWPIISGDQPVKIVVGSQEHVGKEDTWIIGHEGL